MPPAMLMPLLMMLLGFTLLFVALLLVRLRGEILRRERSASWIREVVAQLSEFLHMGAMRPMCGLHTL